MASGRSRSGVRSGLVFVLVGALLAALLLIGDRLAVQAVERRAGQELQGSLGTPDPPKVQIERFPFLTQALTRSLSSVRITGEDVAPPDQPGTKLTSLDLRMHDVTSPDRYRTFHADRVDGSALLDYATAGQLAGRPLSYAPDGRVEVSVQTSFLSNPVNAKVTGRPVVDVEAQTLTLTEPQVFVGGLELPGATAQALLGTVLKPTRLSGIPYGLTVTDLVATPAGLRASLAGSDVSFSR